MVTVLLYLSAICQAVVSPAPLCATRIRSSECRDTDWKFSILAAYLGSSVNSFHYCVLF